MGVDVIEQGPTRAKAQCHGESPTEGFDQPLVIGSFEVPLFRTGFRMVIFSILLMIVVLIYRRGLMGTNEFSWGRIINRFKKREGGRS